MIAALLIPLATLSPADTPIEPIPASALESSIATDPNMITVCLAYSEVSTYLYATMSSADALMLMATVDQWAIDQFETGWEGADGSARLTDEAEVVLLDFLHDCA